MRLPRDSFRCPQCDAPKSKFFDLTDVNDVRSIAHMENDADFEYEIVTIENVANRTDYLKPKAGDAPPPPPPPAPPPLSRPVDALSASRRLSCTPTRRLLVETGEQCVG